MFHQMSNKCKYGYDDDDGGEKEENYNVGIH